jgi:tRNA(Ile)-lysidine synthase
VLLTAHTLDDQAETVLMRAAAGSGLSGLAGMRRAVFRGRLLHLRPFLAVPKASLVATCVAEGWTFIDDPSNHNPQYARTRWRHLLPRLAEEGLDATRIAHLAARMKRADDALTIVAQAAFARYRSAPLSPPRHDAGGDTQGDGNPVRVHLDFVGLLQEPAEIAVRCLAFAIEAADRGLAACRLTSTPRPAIRLERLEACFAALVAASQTRQAERRTLAGRKIVLDRQGLLTISPESLRQRGSHRVTEIAAGPPHSLGMDDLHA